MQSAYPSVASSRESGRAASPLLQGLRAVLWLAIRPSAFREYVAHIDPSLEGDFAYSGLSIGLWRKSPRLRRLMLLVYGAWPSLLALVGLAATLWRTQSEEHVNPATTSVMISVLLSSIVLNAAMGANVGVAAGLVASSVLFFGFFTVWTLLNVSTMSTELWVLLFGCALGAATRLMERLPRDRGRTDLVACVRGSLRGMSGYALLAMASGFFGVAAALVAPLLREGVLEASSIGPEVLSWGAAAAMSMLFGLSVAIRVGKWERGVFFALCLLPGVLLTVMVGMMELEEKAAVSVGLGSIPLGMLACLFGIVLFSIPYGLARQVGGNAAATFSGVSSWLVLLTAVGVMLGSWPDLIAPFLFAVLVGRLIVFACYPFLTAWNALLLLVDTARPSRSSSLVRWNSAFWNEADSLPAFCLDNHLALLRRRNKAAWRRLEEEVEGGPQGWATRWHVPLDQRAGSPEHNGEEENLAAASDSHGSEGGCPRLRDESVGSSRLMSRLGRAFGTGRSSFRLLAWLVAVSMCVGLATGIPIGWAAAPPASIPNEAPVEVVHIVVASQDLDSGRRLTETDVFLVPWPADMVVETWATDIDSVIDTRAIVPISRGMPISMNMLERETVPKWGVTATPKGTP